jgi:hypothetical protein
MGISWTLINYLYMERIVFLDFVGDTYKIQIVPASRWVDSIMQLPLCSFHSVSWVHCTPSPPVFGTEFTFASYCIHTHTDAHLDPPSVFRFFVLGRFWLPKFSRRKSRQIPTNRWSSPQKYTSLCSDQYPVVTDRNEGQTGTLTKAIYSPTTRRSYIQHLILTILIF